jgi:hypothetical protein
MSHVLEHTIRPDLLFSKIHSLLKNEGIFFIEVPNCENPTILSRSILDNPSTFHFTKKSLIELSHKNNFKILKADYFVRKRSFVEKMQRGLEKYFGLKVKEHPFHFETTINSTQGIDLRILLIKKE